MKRILLMILLTIASSLSFGQSEALSLPTSLSKTMKAMSSDLKTISIQVKNPQLNISSASLADHFVLLVLHSKEFVPDFITSLPASEQGPAKARYNLLLDQTADLGSQLSTAFQGNDNNLANTLLGELSKARHEGHDEFNP